MIKRLIIVFIFLQLNICSGIIFSFLNRVSDVKFLLGSMENGRIFEKEILLNDVATFEEPAFNKGANKTVILIHGFWKKEAYSFPKTVRNAYLETSGDTKSVNVITVDWGPLSRPIPELNPVILESGIYPSIYPFVLLNSLPFVGRRVSSLLTFLETSGVRRDSIHMIGHSLGAYLCGMAASAIGANGGMKIGRITGLDPARIFFEDTGFGVLGRMLSKEDAQFVDIYHTAMGTRGVSEKVVVGHVDFYPNGGIFQPGCAADQPNAPFSPSDPFGKGTCSHEVASDIFAATVRRRFTACKCLFSSPGLTDCLKQCPEAIDAGDKCPPNATGQYYFATGTSPMP